MAISPDFLPGPTGPELDPYQPVPQDDYLFPADEDSHQDLVRWCNSAFLAADGARSQYQERWERYYKLYRSYLPAKPGDWHSRVFIPIVFWIIETITPRLVAQLPKFVAYPIGPEDQDPAEHMEQLLDWAVQESDLYVELVKAFKSALKYGTGIIKTFHRQDIRRARKMRQMTVPLTVPMEMPVIDPETGLQMYDPDGQPLVEMKEYDTGQVIEMGQQAQKYSYVAYDGPAAECIDIFNFWPAPEAEDLDSARYVIHRTFRELSYVQRRVQEGIYRWPENMGPDEVSSAEDDPMLSRLSSIGLGAGSNSDPTRKPVELLEFWTDDGRVITMANRKAILRVQENPFDHSEKPFVRVVDYLAEHEFWGIGEAEPLEGLQDLQNALVNSRIDNVRLVLNAMFAVNVSNIEDIRDLKMRPGGVVRVKGDLPTRDVIERIDLGDVTSSAFEEAAAAEATTEKVSGVSAYQMGLDSPSLNNTATGVAIIQEQGASRFGLKSKLAELMGLRRLARHYGSILQQFLTEERTVRLTGPDGQALWSTFAPDSIQGGLDYNIQSESTTQTQTVRLDQKMNLLNLVAQFAPQGVMAALDDVLDAMGIKDKGRYLAAPPPMMPGQMPMPGQPSLPGSPGSQIPAPSPDSELAALGGDPTQGTQGAMMADQRLAEIAQLYNQQAQA